MEVNRTPQVLKVVGNFINYQQTADAPPLEIIVGDGVPTDLTPGSTIYTTGEAFGTVWIRLPDEVEIPAGQDAIRVNLAYGWGDYRPPNWAADVFIANALDADGNKVPVLVANPLLDDGRKAPFAVEPGLDEDGDRGRFLVELWRPRNEFDTADLPVPVRLTDQYGIKLRRDAQSAGRGYFVTLDNLRNFSSEGRSGFVRLGGGKDGQAEADSLYTRLGGGRDGQLEADGLWVRLGGNGRDGQTHDDSLYVRIGGGRDGQAAGEGLLTEIDGVTDAAPLPVKIPAAFQPIAAVLPAMSITRHAPAASRTLADGYFELAANSRRRALYVYPAWSGQVARNIAPPPDIEIKTDADEWEQLPAIGAYDDNPSGGTWQYSAMIDLSPLAARAFRISSPWRSNSNFPWSFGPLWIAQYVERS